MNTVSENLKRIRQERNLTQQQMADLLFVTQQTISGWEKGKAMPAVDTLTDIADKLGVEIYDLIYPVDENREKLKMKVKFFMTLSFLLFIIWQVCYRVGYQIRNITFQSELYYLAIYFLAPITMFLIPYTAVIFYKSRRIIKKDSYFPMAKTVRIIIFAFMIISVTPYLIILAKIQLNNEFVLEIFRVITNTMHRYPWMYSVIGTVYALADTSLTTNP